jgi:RNA chaperone Hfq
MKSVEFDEYSETIFLDSLHNKNVNVFLLGGVKLVGEFYGHDNVSIFLKKDNSEQLVYKRAISSISQVNTRNQNGIKYI